jgi:hypothetical protein
MTNLGQSHEASTSRATSARILPGDTVVNGTLPLIAVFALWVFCNPFFGIDSSSLIYVGRALADLDPSGVGRDIMFRLDGQSGFTIFTPIMDALARMVGLSNATILVAALSVVASFSGAVVFAFAIANDRLRYLIVVFAATLPAYYGGYKVFSYAEAAASPRPFAETFVLFGLAALLKNRLKLSILLMLCAALLHPIMAMGGIAILALWLITTSQRWALLVLVALAAAIGAAALFPILARPTALIDPDWRAVLVARNPYLFPGLWLTGWVGRAAARTATLLVAASFVSPPIRKLFLIALAVGYGSLAVSYIFGERLSWLLVLQLQPWRMMWLVFALGVVAAAICVSELWRRDSVGRIVLLLLALAWASDDYDGLATLLSIAAMAIFFSVDPKLQLFQGKTVWVLLAGLGTLFLAGLLLPQISLLATTAAAPEGFSGEARRTLALTYDYTAIAALISVWFLAGWPHVSRAVFAAGSGVLAALALYSWDQRSLANRYFDSGKGAPELEAIMAARPGEVYWVDGLRETWWWLHRPSWASTLQGAGIVFSRDLALLYEARVQRAMSLGLADQSIETPFQQIPADKTLVLTRENVGHFCAYPDAPAWIVAPVGTTVHIAPDVAAIAWTAPIPDLRPLVEDDGYRWESRLHYAVIRCAAAG